MRAATIGFRDNLVTRPFAAAYLSMAFMTVLSGLCRTGHPFPEAGVCARTMTMNMSRDREALSRAFL